MVRVRCALPGLSCEAHSVLPVGAAQVGLLVGSAQVARLDEGAVATHSAFHGGAVKETAGAAGVGEVALVAQALQAAHELWVALESTATP